MAPFYGQGSTASRLEPLRGGSLLFTTKFPENSGTHFTELGRMKGWVDLGATQWFWTWDRWIGNPAPWPLGHCSIKLKLNFNRIALEKETCEKIWLISFLPRPTFQNIITSQATRKEKKPWSEWVHVLVHSIYMKHTM